MVHLRLFPFSAAFALLATGAVAASLRRQTASASCPSSVIGVFYSVAASDSMSAQPLLPEDVPASLATHAVFSGVSIDASSAMVTFPSIDDNGLLMDRFVAHVTTASACVKPLLGFGPSDSTDLFATALPWSEIAASDDKRSTFALSALNMARAHGFVGIHLDWSSEATNGKMNAVDMHQLVVTLKAAILSESADSGTIPLLLTVTLPCNVHALANAYLPASLQGFVDYFFLQSYGFQDAEGVTAPHAPLASVSIPGHGLSDSVESCVKRLSNIPKHKIVLGVPAFATAVSISDSSTTTPQWGKYGLESVGDKAVEGRLSRTPGRLYYSEIMSMMCFRHHSQQSAASSFVLLGENCDDPEEVGDLYVDIASSTVYALFRGTWLSFDDQDTAVAKAVYMKTNGFAGGFVSGSVQDYRNAAGSWSHSLQHSLYSTLTETIVAIDTLPSPTNGPIAEKGVVRLVSPSAPPGSSPVQNTVIVTVIVTNYASLSTVLTSIAGAVSLALPTAIVTPMTASVSSSSAVNDTALSATVRVSCLVTDPYRFSALEFSKSTIGSSATAALSTTTASPATLVTVTSVELVNSLIAASLADSDVPITTTGSGSPTTGEKIKGWATTAWESWPYKRTYLYMSMGGLVAMVAAGVTYKRCSKRRNPAASTAAGNGSSKDETSARPGSAGSKHHSVGHQERSLKEWRQFKKRKSDERSKSRTASDVEAIEADARSEAVVAEAKRVVGDIQVYPTPPRAQLLAAPSQPVLQHQAWQSGGLTRSVSGSSTPRHPASQCVIDVVEATKDDVEQLSVSNKDDQQHTLSRARSVRQINAPSTPSSLSTTRRSFGSSQREVDDEARSSQSGLHYTKITIPRTPTSVNRNQQ